MTDTPPISFWEKLRTAQGKFELLRWVFLAVGMMGGMLFNAAYGVVEMLKVPFDNQKDIVILLEKSQQLDAMLDSMEDTNDKLDGQAQQIIELKGQIRQLEDGQLRLFLQVERLDERSRKQ